VLTSPSPTLFCAICHGPLPQLVAQNLQVVWRDGRYLTQTWPHADQQTLDQLIQWTQRTWSASMAWDHSRAAGAPEVEASSISTSPPEPLRDLSRTIPTFESLQHFASFDFKGICRVHGVRLGMVNFPDTCSSLLSALERWDGTSSAGLHEVLPHLEGLIQPEGSKGAPRDTALSCNYRPCQFKLEDAQATTGTTSIIVSAGSDAMTALLANVPAEALAGPTQMPNGTHHREWVCTILHALVAETKLQRVASSSAALGTLFDVRLSCHIREKGAMPHHHEALSRSFELLELTPVEQSDPSAGVPVDDHLQLSEGDISEGLEM